MNVLTKLKGTLLISVFITAQSACVLFDRSVPSVSNSNIASPVPASTLLPGDEASPPVTLIEQLGAEMRAASLDAAAQRHPASKLVGDGCTEISFALLESTGDQTQYTGLYRCTMKGSILGINSYDFQVHVIGEIRKENGSYTKRIVSAT